VKLKIRGIEDGQPIPEAFAFGVYSETEHMALGPNRNPELSWEEVPEGARSFVVIMFDPDVPSVGDDVNQEGRSIPRDLPRVDFYHWLLIDIPASATGIAEAADSDGVTPKGKPVGPGAVGVRGVNDYTGFMAGDPDMGGVYGGYDGPCPPWNDERLHHYHFEVHALDVDTLGLSGEFGGEDVRKAMAGHVLASARVTGTYTLNPALR